MRLAVDTNVLVRAVVQDDPVQAGIAAKVLAEAELIAVALPCLCEFVWVLRRVYGFQPADAATAIRALLATANVEVNRPAVEAGLAVLEAGERPGEVEAGEPGHVQVEEGRVDGFAGEETDRFGARGARFGDIVVDDPEPAQHQLRVRSGALAQTDAALAGHRAALAVIGREGLDLGGCVVEPGPQRQVAEHQTDRILAIGALAQIEPAVQTRRVQRPADRRLTRHLTGQTAVAAQE